MNLTEEKTRIVRPDVIDNTGIALFSDPDFNPEDHGITYIVPAAYIQQLHDAQSRDLFIPEGALDFLDMVSRLRKEEQDLSKGAEVNGSGARLRILALESEKSHFVSTMTIDDYIQKLLKKISGDGNASQIEVVTQQKATRALYRLQGINAVDFEFDPWDPRLVGKGVLSLDQYTHTDVKRILIDTPLGAGSVADLEAAIEDRLMPNQFVRVYSKDKQQKYDYYRVALNERGERHLEPFRISEYKKTFVQGVKPRNDEQALLLKLLETCDVVGVHGGAGTGKTIMALAYLTDLVLRDKLERVIITKPIVDATEKGFNKLGYTKGDKINKLRQWFRNFFDNIPKLKVFSEQAQGQIPNLLYDTWGELDTLKTNQGDSTHPFGIYELESADYIRGGNFENVGIIIDESQNLTPHELRAIISRMDRGSKLVLIGDFNQVDRQYQGPKYNGYLAFVKAYWGRNYFGMVEFTECQRHPAAEDAIYIPEKTRMRR